MRKRTRRALSSFAIGIMLVILAGIFLLHVRVLPNDTIALQGTYVQEGTPSAVVVHSRQEFEDRLGIGANVTLWDSSGAQLGAESLARFDNDFFAKHDLVVSFYQASSGSDMVKVNCAYKIPFTPNGAIVWVAQEPYSGQGGWRTSDVANWTILVPISK